MKEKTWITEMIPETDDILYTITSNNERTRYYLNDAAGKRLHTADNPNKFEKDIQRMRRKRNA